MKLPEVEAGAPPGLGALATRGAGDLDPRDPLPEYPRPRLCRAEWLSLNGPWDYEILAPGAGVPRKAGTTVVPFCLESSLSGVGENLLPDERLVYRRRFAIPDSWRGRPVLLNVGAADWRAEVILNGHRLGVHEGGFTPFSFELTEALRPCEEANELVILVEDPTDAGSQARGKQSLTPSGCFYTACSGIWQTVWLEPVPETRITELRVETLPGLTEVDLVVEANARCAYRAAVRAEGHVVARGEGRAGEPLRLEIPGARPWSPADPLLYGLEVEILDGDAGPADHAGSYFGLRTFGVGTEVQGKPALLLNGRPFFFHGVLDQGYFPDGIYTAPTDRALAFDLEAAKALGFTMVRKHVKVEPARWYWHAARLGLVVWQDMPSGGGFRRPGLPDVGAILGFGLDDRKPAARRRLRREDAAGRAGFERELAAMVDSLRGETAIGAWVPFNEGWGQFDALRVAADVKRRDPGRIVDHASGWFDQGGGELHSVHRYFSRLRKPPGGRGRPFALTEYGGYNLAVPGHLWPFDRAFGYRHLPDPDALCDALRLLFSRQILPLCRKGLAAAVYTQLTDVERETNGLYTYDRGVCKVDAAAFREYGKLPGPT